MYNTSLFMKISFKVVILSLVVVFLHSYSYTGYTSILPSPCGSPSETAIDSMDVPGDWQVLTGGGAISASLSLVEGCHGQALQLTYDLGNTKGAWVQIRRNFTPNRDISRGDHLRFYYKGTTKNNLEVALVSNTNENYFTHAFHEVTHVSWSTYATWDYRSFLKDGQPFPDFSQVKAIFISISNNTDKSVGGTGSIVIDELQYLNLTFRVTPGTSESLSAAPSITQQAAAWIAAQQQLGGLVKSYQEEPADFAWLYDQALALLVFTETNLTRAQQLARKLSSLQNPDGSWYAGYHYLTNVPLSSTKPVGANAWTVYALKRYFLKTNKLFANQDALQGANWLASLQRSDGGLPGFQGDTSAPTEPNLDAWWALQITGSHKIQANKLRAFILGKLWDGPMRRFKSDPNTYKIFLDNQTLGAAFLNKLGYGSTARHVLSYAQNVLITSSSDGNIVGFDGAGPFSVWNEGTLQYISQRGEGSQYYWDKVASLQAPNGGLPHSPDGFEGYIVWHSPWHSVASTAWLYFAGKGTLLK